MFRYPNISADADERTLAKLEGKKSDISRVLLSQLQAIFDGSYLSETPVTRRLKRYQRTGLLKNQP